LNEQNTTVKIKQSIFEQGEYNYKRLSNHVNHQLINLKFIDYWLFREVLSNLKVVMGKEERNTVIINIFKQLNKLANNSNNANPIIYLK